jgi:hypothetical protein
LNERLTNLENALDKPILIIGATSGIGKPCMKTALDRGLSVRAFARSADTLAKHPALDRMAGDALNADDIAKAIDRVRAVVVDLGTRERVAMLWEEETLFSRSSELLIAEMQKADVSRLLVVTGFGAGRSRSAMSSLERLGHNAFLGRVRCRLVQRSVGRQRDTRMHPRPKATQEDCEVRQASLQTAQQDRDHVRQAQGLAACGNPLR